jgi:hypothetical protein
MTDKRSNPPRFAISLLRHLSGDNDALAGDLIERFHEGQTYTWFWRQALIAFTVAVMGRHWPDFCYALAGTAMPVFLWKSFHGAGFWLHWWTLPWPWSQLVLELSPTVLLALTALPVLATALLINRAFRWVSLLRTGVINLALITLGHFSLNVPWLFRPLPDDPHLMYLIIPGVVQLLLFFSAFLVAAWLGCVPRRADELRSKAVSPRLV